MVNMILDKNEDGNVLRISIDASSATADKAICLFPGGLTSTTELQQIAGVNVDLIATHGTDSTNGVTVNCPTLAYYQKETAICPVRVKSLQVEADNASQLSFPIEIAQFGLTAKYGQDRIVLTKYKNAKNSNNLLVNVDDIEWMQLDRYTAMFLTVGAGRKLDIVIEIGERFNAAEMLTQFAGAILG